jgi:Phage Terminase
MTAPLDLVASMVLDSGARWGEQATPEQWADMEALLSPDGPRRHFWLRARGRSKTFDAGAATLAMMLAGGLGGGDEAYASAAGRDQAALLMRKVRAIAEHTPELAGAVEVQNYRLVTPRTGAVLDVISSDLASSWGRTPRWLFIDEIANHDRGETAQTFNESLLTSLPKRGDSQALAATTPSSPSHWSHDLWKTAQEDPLWRASLTAGPAPWQSEAELASERRRLPESLWRRLFLCEWAEADDALADAAAVEACVRHDGPLSPQAGIEYIVSFDLSVSHDHTACVVAHMEDASGRREIVVDRLQAWIPHGGRQVDLLDVESWIAQAARDYHGAQVVGDMYQAANMVQRLRDSGLRVKPVVFTSVTNSRRAQMLLRLIRDRSVDLPDDASLRRELLSLRLAEGVTPGTLKLTTDGSSAGHHDRVTALMIAAEELLGRPGGSYLEVYGVRYCSACGRAHPVARQRCQHCGEPNPQAAAPAADEAAPGPDGPGQPVPVQATGWASAYMREGFVRCAAGGHLYDSKVHGDRCPRCIQGSAGFLRGGGRFPGTGGFGGISGIR